MELYTIIGRGHSGTRAMSHTLSGSGVYMGAPQNDAGDLLPPEDMYEACRVMARHVEHKGGLEWDFSKLQTVAIDPTFKKLIESFLSDVLANDAPKKGWKIPETTLAWPWIVRMFPDIRAIYWTRNPRDCILKSHLTDDLHRFGIDYPQTDDERKRRAISWKYQYDLVKATPEPAHVLRLSLEDFVQDQDACLEKLGEFVGLPMTKIPVKPEAIGRFQQDPGISYYDFLGPAMTALGYPVSAAV